MLNNVYNTTESSIYFFSLAFFKIKSSYEYIDVCIPILELDVAKIESISGSHVCIVFLSYFQFNVKSKVIFVFRSETTVFMSISICISILVIDALANIYGMSISYCIVSHILSLNFLTFTFYFLQTKGSCKFYRYVFQFSRLMLLRKLNKFLKLILAF